MDKDEFKGQICTIIGNGPSLRDVPIQFLKKYPSFGLNRIYLLDSFLPTYYINVDDMALKTPSERDKINSMTCEKFVRAECGVEGHQLISNHKSARSRKESMFSYDPLVWINAESWTGTYVSFQLAYWLGFATVLLVGLDNRYIVDKIKGVIHNGDEFDVNHFTPDYHKGLRWYTPRTDKMEEHYKIAKAIFYKDGRRIINLSKGSALKIFPFDTVENWL